MRLKEKYKKELVPKLKDKFGYQNDLAVPRLVKAVVNVGFGRQAKDKAVGENIGENLAKITGQKAVFTKAKQSISAFKIRKGMVVGAKVTLRGNRFYDFVEKLINIAFPRVRDFRGLDQKAVDRSGCLTVGFKEHLAFPEIKADDIENIHGLEVCISSTARNREEGLELFKSLGFPFRSEKEKTREKN